jgi:hypothetical protein
MYAGRFHVRSRAIQTHFGHMCYTGWSGVRCMVIEAFSVEALIFQKKKELH